MCGAFEDGVALSRGHAAVIIFSFLLSFCMLHLKNLEPYVKCDFNNIHFF